MSEFLKKNWGRIEGEKGRKIKFLPLSHSPFLPFYLLLLVLAILSGCSSCRTKNLFDKRQVKPRTLRDVPAQRLSYRLETDVSMPQGANVAERNDKVQAVENDFAINRQADALDRAILSPDKQKVIAIYQSPDSGREEYQIDIYGVGGNLIRKVTTPEMAVVFPSLISWSPDGTHLAFIARRSEAATPTPNEGDKLPGLEGPRQDETPTPTPIGPIVTAFPNEQIFVCKNDGLDLKPLTLKISLIYFYFAWSPDSAQLVALACTENEEKSRSPELLPAGRPRLIDLKGNERLLDDDLTDVLPVWSPDSSKVATAFGTNVKIYDAGTDAPSQAVAQLREQLLAASRVYEEAQKKSSQNSSGASSNTNASPTLNAGPATIAEDELPSFNPIVRLYWTEAKTLHLLTAYIRIYENGPVNNFPRWHTLVLSPQAAALD
jgi:hypothetical protein